MRTCSAEDCRRPHAARGYCMRHYHVERRAGRIAVIQRPTRVCVVVGCGKRHQARGWCMTHYRRWFDGREVEPSFDLTDSGEL